MVGGGLVYLECEEENSRAYDFYIRFGFKEFDHRWGCRTTSDPDSLLSYALSDMVMEKV